MAITTGLRAVLDALQKIVKIRGGGLVTPRRSLERRDVRAGDERPARALDDDRRDVRIRFGGIQRGGERLGHAAGSAR